MSEHFGFSEDEWELVHEIPLDIYLCMALADPTVASLTEEHLALQKWLEKAAIACDDSPWMKAAIETAHRPSRAQANGASPMPAPELVAKLGRVTELLGQRVSPGESRAYKRLLLALAEQVAASSGGAMPGSPRVSQAEGDLIWKIRQALAI